VNWESKLQRLENILIQLLKSQILPSESYLAGGTALYYYLHHRLSVDLDFFTKRDFNPEMFIFKLSEEFGIADVEIIEKESLIVFLSPEKIKFSLFLFPYHLLSPLKSLELSKGITCPAASLEDIAAMKAIAISQRGSAKDFIDLYYLLKHTQFKFDDFSSFVRQKYHLEKKYEYHMKTAMVYFDDAERELDSIVFVQDKSHFRQLSESEWKDIREFFGRFIQ
jgi:predicted nucleotidyltransferase component of viral defense system